MKNIIKVTIVMCVSLVSLTVQAQTNIFLGHWKYQEGNEVFIVHLWEENGDISGHFKKIIVDAQGNEVSEIYNSNKTIGNSVYYWPSTIYVSNNNSNSHVIGGAIEDNTVPNTIGSFIGGTFSMEILSTGNPTTAKWEAKQARSLLNQPNWNIPDDIILTKFYVVEQED